MAAEVGPELAQGHSADVPVILIPEVRDYQRINSELAARLDEGYCHIRLAGADGHRLLVAQLAGSWKALIEIEGRIGPEIASGLDAPGLTVICRGSTADGAGSGLKQGHLVILGDTGNVVGYAQNGGFIVVVGNAGHRAGLNQAGGTLVLLGKAGRLVGERQLGGSVHARPEKLGPHFGYARRGGEIVSLSDRTSGETRDRLKAIWEDITQWVSYPSQ